MEKIRLKFFISASFSYSGPLHPDKPVWPGRSGSQRGEEKVIPALNQTGNDQARTSRSLAIGPAAGLPCYEYK
jgi:hypothetical protein